MVQFYVGPQLFKRFFYAYALWRRAVATLNRGFIAQESDRVGMEEIIEMLELENPNPKPCEAFASQSSPIAGRWQ